jgi:hypothetical protein
VKDILDRIVRLDCYAPAFAKLSQADPESTTQIRTALLKATEESHRGIVRAEDNPDRLRYWVYREAVEVKAHSSSYLSYSEMMATREANLLRFAMSVTERFFELIFDDLDAYFSDKKERMVAACETDSRWYSTVTDSSKKLLTPVNWASRFIKQTSEQLGQPLDIPDGALVDTKGTVETILSAHLDKDQVAKDVTAILEHAAAQVRESWKKTIQAQAPDLAELKAFAAGSGAGSALAVDFHLGLAEQTLAVGLGAGLAGTFGLAAGWHTLSYGMLNVFPPVAIFAVIAAAGLAFFTQEQAMENRRKQIRDAADKYLKQLLVEIDTRKMNELGGHTMREAMQKENKRIVAATLRQWEQSISGRLRAEHYRLLIAATTQHLTLVDEALAQIETAEGTTTP